MTINEMNIIMNELADEIPAEMYEGLNGGISLVEGEVLSPYAIDGDLYVLGAYHTGGGLGRYITIHYGSFIRVYGHLSAVQAKEKLRKILRHEFRHHVESLAGEHGLEYEDELFMRKYYMRKAKRNAPE